MRLNEKYIISDKLGNMYQGFLTFDGPCFSADIRKAKLYKTEKSALYDLEYLNEHYMEHDEVLHIYKLQVRYEQLEEDGVYREVKEKKLEDRIKEAYSIANNAIYFNDSSDYKGALLDVLKTLNPEFDENKQFKYIEEDKY